MLALPFDLMRHDMLMTYEPIPLERVLAIVDDLFMPLIAGQGGAGQVRNGQVRNGEAGRVPRP